MDGDQTSNRDHRMGLQAGRRRIRRRRARSRGAETAVPELQPVDGLLVGVLALHQSGGVPVLGEAGQVPGLPGEPLAAAVVRAGTAAGPGAGGGPSAGRRGGRPGDAAAGPRPGRAARDAAGMAAALPGPGAGVGGGLRGSDGGPGWAGAGAVWGARAVGAGGAGGGLVAGPAAVRRERGGGLRVRQSHERRGAAGRHHKPTLGTAGASGFDASGPVNP
jgi:hypothetical protein